jgi:hypothetical protein
LAIVDKYGPLIADIIVEEVTPDNVCELIGLCSGSSSTIPKEEPFNLNENSLDDSKTQTCVMCQFLANMLSKIIDKNMDEVI